MTKTEQCFLDITGTFTQECTAVVTVCTDLCTLKLHEIPARKGEIGGHVVPPLVDELLGLIAVER